MMGPDWGWVSNSMGHVGEVVVKGKLNRLSSGMDHDNAQTFRTKVYPLALVEEKQLDNFLEENLKS